MAIELWRGDITTLALDAIVNAANSSLLGGGGVDGAIHRAAGPRLLAACQELRNTQLPAGLPTGQAVVTPGFDLPAKWVVHTVGPIYASDPHPAQSLAAAYRESAIAALEVGARTIAFPAISAGVYGYPLAAAAKIAVATAREFEAKFDRLVFALFSAEALATFERALAG